MNRPIDASGALDLSDDDFGADSTLPSLPAAPLPILAGAELAEFGRYRIVGELGQGGMGKVYLAEDPQLGRRVALKVVLAGAAGTEARERFLREARTMARLEHPHIARIHDIGEEQGQPYFTMEYVEGTSLDRANLGAGPERLERTKGLAILAKVARAVAYAHGQGVIHRDLKPSNILIDHHGEPRVMDFGLARLVAEEGAMLSRSGALIGTPAYMSPEQADRRGRDVDETSDVWALGVILYELATGERPFVGSEVSLYSKIVREDPVAPRARRPGVPRDVETIALSALQKAKEKRYPTAAAFAEDLERFLSGQPILARPLTLFERCVRYLRRHRIGAAASILVGLAGGGVGVARALIEEKGQEAESLTRSTVEAESKEIRDLELVTAYGRFEERLAEATREGADVVAFDALAEDLARLRAQSRELDSPPPNPGSLLSGWEAQLALGMGRGIVQAALDDRFDEARRHLESAGSSPEALLWRARLEWAELPAEIRSWPGPRGHALLDESERARVESTMGWWNRIAGDARDLDIALYRAKLALALGRTADAKSALEPFRQSARDRAPRESELVFELYRGLVLAEALAEPPGYGAIDALVAEAIEIWRDPEIGVEDRALVVRVAYPASVPFWDRWLALGAAADLKRVRDWLLPALEASQRQDWVLAGATDMPWLAGVSLLVLGPPDHGYSPDPFACLGDAETAPFPMEPRYREAIPPEHWSRFAQQMARRQGGGK